MKICARRSIMEAWIVDLSWNRVPQWLIEAMLTGEIERDEQTGEIRIVYPVRRKVEAGDVIIRNTALELTVVPRDEFDRDYVWLEEPPLPI